MSVSTHRSFSFSEAKTAIQPLLKTTRLQMVDEIKENGIQQLMVITKEDFEK